MEEVEIMKIERRDSQGQEKHLQRIENQGQGGS